MKKFINAPDAVVTEAVAGMAAAHAGLLSVSSDPLYVSRARPKSGKVAVVSGGGSGHEPLHAGFVGEGMLDAAVPGAMFTSPTPDQILAAIQAVSAGRGVLLIVKNYTGDVLNFEMAADLARAEGIEVEQLLIADDVAVDGSLYTTGRRGVATTVLAEKICGAAAESGASLAEVAEIGRRVAQAGRSIGVALTSCTVPHKASPSFEIGDDEMEFGVGIHGEPGRRRMPIKGADEIAGLLMAAILDDLPYRSGDEVLLFVNGLGGTPLVELYVLFRKAAEIAARHGLTIRRSLVGSLITSLDMAGASITLMKLDDTLTRLWDAPALTPAFRTGM